MHDYLSAVNKNLLLLSNITFYLDWIVNLFRISSWFSSAFQGEYQENVLQFTAYTLIALSFFLPSYFHSTSLL
jgi:hypothetical protein